MTDPGWDIPGLPRDDAARLPAARAQTLARGLSARPAGESRRTGKRGSKGRPAVSVSALDGSSAGAFARPGGSVGRLRMAHRRRPLPRRAAASSAASSPARRRPRPAPLGARDRRLRLARSAAAARPADAAQALAFCPAALEFLAHADPAEWGEGLQADCLRALAVAESRQAAAHARVLSAFSRPGGGLAGDGHRSPRVWLTWQTAATRRAASGKVGWMRRLAEHPAVAAALADGSVSVSWARQICDWTGRLPAAVRDDADGELLAAAANGAGLTELAFIAEDLRREHARPDSDGDGFEDRQVRLSTTLDGAGRLTGDLTPRCAAAVEAVLDSLAQPGRARGHPHHGPAAP